VKHTAAILNNDNLKQKLKKNIRDHVKRKMGWLKVDKSHIKVYHKIVRVPYGQARHIFGEDEM